MTISFPLLTPDQIEVKVKQVNDGNVVLLLYKTARTDMDMLDKVVGPMGWTTDYKEIKGNLYCGIGIFDDAARDWVWKWDCGTESRADDEGNQKKGEASDAFKRAGFKWGVGRELYTAPSIRAFVPTEANRYNKLVLKEKHHRFDGFVVGDIGYEDGRIVRLRIDDSRGTAVYTYPRNGASRTQPPADDTKADTPLTSRQYATEAQKSMLRNMVNVEQLAACDRMYGEGWGKMTASQCDAMIRKIEGERAAS